MVAPKLVPVDFGAGVANRIAPTKLPRGFVVGADNVDISDDRVVARRQGYTQFIALAGAHSFRTAPDLLFGLVCAAGTLYAVYADASYTPLVTGLSDGPVHYCMTPLGVYWSADGRCGRIGFDASSSPWGVEGVPSFGLSTDSVGGLDAGRYGVALAFANDTREEGGATESRFVDVPSGGGIRIAGIPAPQDTSTSEVRIYVTGANGTELQYAGSAPAGMSTYSIGAGRRGRQLGPSQFCVPFPAVQFPLLKNGRLLGAQGSYLIWSEPLYYGLHNPMTNFVRLHGEPIVMVSSPESEAFVAYLGTQTHTYVLRGESIESARISVASNVGVIPGSMAMLQPDVLKIDGIVQPVPAWVDKRGVPVIGTAEGIIPLSDKFAYPLFGSSSSFFSQSDSMSRYIVSGRGGAPSGLAVSDRVVARTYDAGGGA